MTFCVWLLSLSMMVSKSIHVVAYIRASLCCMPDEYPSAWTHHNCLYIHQLACSNSNTFIIYYV